MRAIIVDDEPIMISSFVRLSRDIPDLQIIGRFEDPAEAFEFVKTASVDLAFLDVRMPVMNGIELAKKIREINPEILIVFISAYDEYIRESNQIGGDYYIVKPYKKEILEMVMDRLRLIARRQDREIYIQMFGKFNVLRNGTPIPLSGKAKEIFALVVSRRGKLISNREIFSIIWENRSYSNENMTVYYNALRRLKNTLKNEGIDNLLLSNHNCQMVNTELFDCDYYSWQDDDMQSRDRFEGEFLSEYSWGESILANIMWKESETE